MKQVGLVRQIVGQMPIAYNQYYVYVRQAPVPLPVALNQFVPLNIRILFESHNLGYMCHFGRIIYNFKACHKTNQIQIYLLRSISWSN